MLFVGWRRFEGDLKNTGDGKKFKNGNWRFLMSYTEYSEYCFHLNIILGAFIREFDINFVLFFLSFQFLIIIEKKRRNVSNAEFGVKQ